MRYICTSIVATLALAGTSFAATINVPGEQPTIAAAIDASSDGDVIAIAAGTYYEHSLNPNGKAITIGSASGNLDVTIDAQQGGSVFMIESGEDDGTVIKDLVITGGLANYYGGGIDCWYSSPTITDCTIQGNTADYSGGIFCLESSPTISGCTISYNSATSWGGGIFCYKSSSPTITNCTISGNTAGDNGGGIYCLGSDPNISNCTITGNTAHDGGGVYLSSGSHPTISGCTISGNTAGDNGGGIYCYWDETNPNHSGNPTIMDSTICGNDPDQIYGDWTDNGGNTVADECPIPEGACCVGSSCSVETEADCVSAGGTYQGDNSDCSDGLCYGACCVTSGCDVMAEVMCTNLGGTWLGADGSCDDCPASCMGDTDGNGVVNIEDLLNMLGSWGACP